jgi:hypothetical protein
LAVFGLPFLSIANIIQTEKYNNFSIRPGIAISLDKSHGAVLCIIARRFSNTLESIARGPVKGFEIEKMTYITNPLKAA